MSGVHRILAAAGGLTLLVTAFAPGSAAAQSDLALYRQAMADLDGRPDVAGLCHFTLAVEEPPTAFAFSAVSDGEARWDGPEGHNLPPQADAARTMVAINRSMFESVEPVRLLREEDGLAIFALKSGDFTVSGMGQSVDISEHVEGEAAVDPQTGRFAWVRYHAPQSFRPSPVARFRTFDHRVDVAAAWPDGPMVRTAIHSEIEVSAFFQTHDLGRRLAYSDFIACDPGAAGGSANGE